MKSAALAAAAAAAPVRAAAIASAARISERDAATIAGPWTSAAARRIGTRSKSGYVRRRCSSSSSCSSVCSSSVLFLSPTLWPEPSSSAAGVRTSALLRHFASPDSQLFDDVHYGCGAPFPSSGASVTSASLAADHAKELGSRGIKMWRVPANRSLEVETFLSSLSSHRVDGGRDSGLRCVVFDRYYAEEAYSFHVRNVRPDAITVLDMQDFHALRLGRMALVEDWDDNCDAGDYDGDGREDERAAGTGTMMTCGLMKDVIEYVPSHLESSPSPSSSSSSYLWSDGGREQGTDADADADAETRTWRGGNRNEDGGTSKRRIAKVRDVLLRELASIFRSDLTLVCSEHERRLLTSAYGVPPHKLCLAPFFVPSSSYSSSYLLPAEEQFDRRTDFVFLGGFRHPPNVDSVLWLKRNIWPAIRSLVPGAKVHVWGSYPSAHILGLHDPKVGFYVKGPLPDRGGLEEELRQRRVMIAPLRYGAGVKGKIVDAFRCGLPVATTPVGSEGMSYPLPFMGTPRGTEMTTTTTTTTTTMMTTTNRMGEGGDERFGFDDVGWGGLVASCPTSLARCAAALHDDRSLWVECHSNARRLTRSLFHGERNLRVVDDAIARTLEEREELRSRDVVRSVLWHQSTRSTEYFSRWIELKETGGGGVGGGGGRGGVVSS